MKQEPDRLIVPVTRSCNMNMYEINTQKKAQKYLGDYQHEYVSDKYTRKRRKNI